MAGPDPAIHDFKGGRKAALFTSIVRELPDAHPIGYTLANNRRRGSP
jgi:hypothetical protein